MEKKGTLLNPFYKVSIALIPKPDKNITEKKIGANITDNIDAKILNNISANQIQQYIKRIIHHDQVGFIAGMKDFLIYAINVIPHINKLKNENHMNISIDAEKAFLTQFNIFD